MGDEAAAAVQRDEDVRPWWEARWFLALVILTTMPRLLAV